MSPNGPDEVHESQSTSSPFSLTYAQIAERLNKAKDLAALAAASKLIDSLADESQRDELYELAEQINTDLALAAHDAEPPGEGA